MSKRSGWLLPGLIWLAVCARAQERAPRPEIVVPRLAQAPTVDGTHAPGEWERATALTGFVAATGPLGGVMTPEESAICLAHDGKRLYMAVRCALPPGVKPSMNYRRRDEPVYMDRYQMELWLTPPVKGLLTAYQMIGNAYGAVYDVKQVPELGAVTAGWNGNWEFKNSYRTGEEWTAELSVPFSDFGVDAARADEFWGVMVGVAWPQRSWPYTYGWYKNVDAHAKMTLADDATAVRVESLEALLDNRLDARLAIVNGGDAGREYTVRVAVGDVVSEQRLHLGAGAARSVSVRGELPPFAAEVRSKSCRIEVAEAGGRTLLAGDWPFRPLARAERVAEAGEPKPWALSTRLQFAPLALGVRMWADLLDYPGRDRLRKVRFTVRPKGGGDAVLAHEVETFAYDAAEALLWLPKTLAHGAYEVETAFVSADGRVAERKTDVFEHRDLKAEFPWLDGTVSENIGVAPPFEPVRVAGRNVSVWGREMRFRGALPEQIASQGAEMLAGPAAFVAKVGGKTVAGRATREVAMAGATPEQVRLAGRYEVGGIELDVEGRVEFDGMVYYRVEQTEASRKAAPAVEGLYLSLPVKAAHARYHHSTAGGWSGSFGILGEGKPGDLIWSSDSLSDFVPYVGLSDDERAIQWFADNDHDWVLGDEAPCAELVRTESGVELRVHLVRRAGVVEGLRAEFGLIAAPVKPMPKGWRHTSLDNQSHGSGIAFFYGPGHGGCPVDLHDTGKLAEVLGVDLKGENPDIFFANAPAGSIPFPDLPALRKKLGEFAHKAHAWLSGRSTVRDCWFFNAMMYFEGNRSPAFRTFFPGEWQLDPPSGWFHLTPVESYQDFFSFHMDIWMKHWLVPGLYFDEVYLPQDYNVFNGNGKPMPDGTVRPSVPLMHQRRFLYRMRQTFLNHGKEPFLWVHSSNFMAPYAIGAADVAMFGEDRVATATTDTFDAIPAALLRSIGRSQKFGFIPVWMVQAGRGGDPMRHVARQTYGWCWMHDTVPEYHTSTRGWPLVKLRHAWGIDRDDVRFVPYWNNAAAVATEDPDVLVSLWLRPRGGEGGRPTAHALVTNLNPPGSAVRTVQVTLKAAGLGVAADAKVYDLESQPELVAWEEALAEAERLRAENESAHRERIRELTRNRDIRDAIRYDKNAWRLLGDVGTVAVDVGPRDFRALLVE